MAGADRCYFSSGMSCLLAAPGPRRNLRNIHSSFPGQPRRFEGLFEVMWWWEGGGGGTPSDILPIYGRILDLGGMKGGVFSSSRPDTQEAEPFFFIPITAGGSWGGGGGVGRGTLDM
jgi:hypothetical protein